MQKRIYAWQKSIILHLTVLALLMASSYIWWKPPPDTNVKKVNIHIGTGKSAGHGSGGSIKQDGNKQESKNAQLPSLMAIASQAIAETKAKEHTESVSPLPSQQEATESNNEGANLTGTGQGDGATGEGRGDGLEEGSGTGDGDGLGEGFINNGDGSYTVDSPEGLSYKILKKVDPDYPEEAKEANYTDTIRVRTRFLVGVNGRIEQIEFMNSVPNLGFREAATQALNQWRFANITYKGHPLKVYFTYTFTFVAGSE